MGLHFSTLVVSGEEWQGRPASWALGRIGPWEAESRVGSHAVRRRTDDLSEPHPHPAAHEPKGAAAPAPTTLWGGGEVWGYVSGVPALAVSLSVKKN